MVYVYSCYAGLAQLVEQRIRNAWVGRSNLLTGTNKETPPREEFFYWYREGERTPIGVFDKEAPADGSTPVGKSR